MTVSRQHHIFFILFDEENIVWSREGGAKIIVRDGLDPEDKVGLLEKELYLLLPQRDRAGRALVFA
jgi:hypothetical protein